MASIIKNQILKHLSKFTKNLSADKIKLSTLKGEGDLANLELDELMLMELLDLPTWLKINKAVCNRVSVKVQWTKLKSQPICLYLDEVVVEMETCDKPRGSGNSGSQIPSYSSEGKYGFSDKVVDGIYLSINSVLVYFVANAFKASLQLSRVQLKSKTPTWADGDLRMTRIRDPERGEILLFKELEWLTTRIEASGLEDHKNICSTPLRLIANQAKIRIVIKKRLSDCAIIASRVQLILDDLLWVLTDSQLKEAIMFAQSLKESVQKSNALSKMEAAKKVQEQTGNQHTSQQGQYTSAPMAQKDSQSNVSKVFKRFDIIETSYHLYTGRIDLHLCGDMSTAADPALRAVSSEYAKLLDSGAMQITLSKLSIDYYPYHPAGGDRTHWMNYNEYMINRNAWAQKLLAQFRDDVMTARAKSKLDTSPQNSPSHGPGPRTPTKQRQTKLLESSYIVRLEDFTFFRVSTADSNRQKPKRFFASDKKQLYLPPEMSAIHLEFTDYYFPEGVDYPVPHSNIFGQINPVHLHLDYLTLLWIQSFALKLFKSVTPLMETDDPTPPPPPEHKDIKIEALMPRIVLPAEDPKQDEPERPQGLQIQMSKVIVTNCRIDEKCSKDQLYSVLQELQHGNLFNSNGFPNKEADVIAIPMELLRYAVNGEKPSLDDITEAPEKKEEAPLSPGSETYFNLSTNSLKQEAAGDVWYIGADQFWLEFADVPKHKGRPVPFVESFPLNLWICYPQGLKRDGKKSRNDSRSSLKKLKQFYSLDSNSSTEDPLEGGAFRSMDECTCLTTPATMNLIIHVPAKVFVQMDHYQYVFMMRLGDTIAKYQMEIEKITKASLPSLESTTTDATENTVCVALSLEELEVATLCLPMIDRNELLSARDQTESASLDSSSAKNNDETCSSVTDDQPTSPDSPTANPINVTQKMNGCLEVPGLPASISKSHSDSEILNVPVITETKVEIPDSDKAQYPPMTTPTSPSHSQKGAEIKKSFSSAFSSLDNAFTKGFDKIKQTLDVSDDSSACEEWEVSSVKSGMSDEDDDFLMVGIANMKETVAFRHQRHESNASGSDAKDDDDMSENAMNTNLNDPLRNKMCVTTFRILHTELIAQVKGENVCAKLQVQHIMPNAMGNITPEEFQNKFNFVPKDSIDKPPRLEYFPIKLRFDSGPSAEHLSPGAVEKGFLHIKAKDVMLDIAMSTMQGMSELFEEEMVPPTIPMLIEISNTQISMMEDRPPNFRHTAAPIPVDLLVQNLVVRRNEDGVVNIQGGTRPMSLASVSSASLPTPDSATFSANPEPSPTRDEKDEGSESLLLRLISSKKEMHLKDNQLDGLRNQIEKLKQENMKMMQVQEKYNKMSEQVEKDGVSRTGLLEKMKVLELENKQLMQTVSSQQDELQRLRDDEKSQLSALHILQEELIAATSPK